MGLTEKWWYGFDPVTHQYTGMRQDYEQPANTTDVEPEGLMNPIWDTDSLQWIGVNFDEQLEKLREEAEKNKNYENIPIAVLSESLADFQNDTHVAISNIALQLAQLLDSKE